MYDKHQMLPKDTYTVGVIRFSYDQLPRIVLKNRWMDHLCNSGAPCLFIVGQELFTKMRFL